MSDTVKKFKVTYTNASNQRVTEEPRLMITVDGKHKSLFLGDTPIATVSNETLDAELWQKARAAFASAPVEVK